MSTSLFWIAIVAVFISLENEVSSVELILDRIDQVGAKDHVDASNIKVRKAGKERQIFGKITFKQPLDNSVMIKLNVSKKTGSGYNMLPYKVEKPACDFFTEETYFYPDLVKFSTFPDEMPCPVPSETFEVKGWNPSMEHIPAMLVKHGDYKVYVAFSVGTEEIFGLYFYASIVNMYF